MTFGAVSVGLFACEARKRVDDVDRAISEVNDATARVQKDADSIDPTLRELRSAARALRQLRSSLQP